MKRDAASLKILLEKTKFMHDKGYNCSEAAAWALYSYWNLDIHIAAATGFGGGIARSGATCGALIGAILALGCKVGRVDPEDNEKKDLCYKLGRETAACFADQMKTTLCKDIIGFVLGEPGGPERYSAGGFKAGRCWEAIECAVRAAISVVEKAETRE